MTVNEISRQNPIQVAVAATAFAAAFVLIFLAYAHGSARLAFASIIGLLAGLALYHASFGFTAASPLTGAAPDCAFSFC